MFTNTQSFKKKFGSIPLEEQLGWYWSPFRPVSARKTTNTFILHLPRGKFLLQSQKISTSFWISPPYTLTLKSLFDTRNYSISQRIPNSYLDIDNMLSSCGGRARGCRGVPKAPLRLWHHVTPRGFMLRSRGVWEAPSPLVGEAHRGDCRSPRPLRISAQQPGNLKPLNVRGIAIAALLLHYP